MTPIRRFVHATAQHHTTTHNGSGLPWHWGEVALRSGWDPQRILNLSEEWHLGEEKDKQALVTLTARQAPRVGGRGALRALRATHDCSATLVG